MFSSQLCISLHEAVPYARLEVERLPRVDEHWANEIVPARSDQPGAHMSNKKYSRLQSRC